MHIVRGREARRRRSVSSSPVLRIPPEQHPHLQLHRLERLGADALAGLGGQGDEVALRRPAEHPEGEELRVGDPVVGTPPRR